MKEYKLRLGERVGIYFVLATYFLCASVVLWMTYIGAMKNTFSSMLIGSIIFGIFFALITVVKLKWKLTISDERLVYIDAFSNHNVLLAEVTGYRYTAGHIYIELKDGSKEIKIERRFADDKEFLRWLADNYKDSDKVRYERETAAILENDEYGQSQEERSSKLNEARNISYGLNLAGFVIMVVSIFSKQFVEIQFIISALVPAISLFIYHRYKGLVRLIGENGTAKPTITVAFIFSGVALVVISSSYDIIDSSSLNYYVMIAILLIALAFGISIKDTYKLESNVRYLFAGGIIYIIVIGAMSTRGVNCVLDQTSPASYRTMVISKRIVAGSRGSGAHYVRTEPWGPVTGFDEIKVTADYYEQININDSLKMDLKPGLLGAAWYRLSH